VGSGLQGVLVARGGELWGTGPQGKGSTGSLLREATAGDGAAERATQRRGSLQAELDEQPQQPSGDDPDGVHRATGVHCGAAASAADSVSWCAGTELELASRDRFGDATVGR